MTTAVASGIYNQTLGRLWGGSATQAAEPENETYVCLAYLKRQADQIVRWANKSEKQLISEADLKRQLRKSTQHTEEDINLLLVHMRFSGKMASANVGNQETIDSELVLCKFATIDSTKEVAISVKEKGKFALESSLAKLDSRITQLTTKSEEAVAQAKVALAAKNKQLA